MTEVPTAGPRVRLLGRLEMSLDDRPSGAPTRDSARAEGVLAHLVLHRDGPVPRERVAGLFWPESTEAQARTNLRHVLHTLRTRVPEVDRYLEVTARTLRWRREESCWVDVEEFDRLLAVDEPGDRDRALRDAVALYAGDLLEGLDDDWVHPERHRLRQRYLDALTELSARAEARGDLAEAISVAERARRADPLREPSYHRLMRLHAARGDRATAVAVYHDCSSTLDRELGVPPAPATRAAYAALLAPERAARGPAAADGPVPAPVREAPLVGRAAERARLATAWRDAEAGRARFVLVRGEPGVGKTRLVDEFRGWCARRGAVVADARCYAAEGPLAYGPVVSWLRSPALRLRIPDLDRHRLGELARLLPELVDELPDLPAPGPLPEPELRRRLLDAVAGAVLAPPATVLLVVDDLHHGDDETCQVVHYLLRARPEARLLVVATARAEELDDRHPVRTLLAGLRAADAAVELDLTRLGRAETAELAGRLAPEPLGEADVDRLYAETDGNPLFVVEGLRAGWTGGRGPSPRVQAVISERLLALTEPTRELAEAAALIGRGFGVAVLAAAADVTEDALVTGLDELWRRRIVEERGAHAYDFSHDHIREVAAAGIAPARRRRLHRRIGEALEQGRDADPAAVAGQIAIHYEHAGLAERAADWYCRAAAGLQLLHADAPAVALVERALHQLGTLPESRSRDAAELAARTMLLAPLAAAGGYAAPALSATQRRAADLVVRLEQEPPPPLLRSRAMSASTGGDFAAAIRIGDQLRAAGERDGSDVLVVEGAFLRGVAEFWAAEFPAARATLELAVDRYRPSDRQAHLVHYGNDPKVACLARLGNTWWFLGRPDAARAARDAALAWADEIGHGYSRAIALFFGALLALDMDDEDRLRADTAALVALAADSPQLRLGTDALLGLLAVRDGDAAAGLVAIRDAIARGRGHEAPGLLAGLHRVLLAACVAADDRAGAVAVADHLLATGAGAQVWAAEARRVRAAFLSRTG